jgi:hypothetical protein
MGTNERQPSAELGFAGNSAAKADVAIGSCGDQAGTGSACQTVNRNVRTEVEAIEGIRVAGKNDVYARSAEKRVQSHRPSSTSDLFIWQATSRLWSKSRLRFALCRQGTAGIAHAPLGNHADYLRDQLTLAGQRRHDRSS